ncbi:GbsR/MarR family transcriptional regulator [Catenulispora pinisilvae]|uniref:GbsR/MarR family transcriptional regulator n=1 Tax=Catenulispora pinisilvae TaxID=2705253 RepID=UPI0018926DC7|nr:helix-turn-helix domain-containing protein [Catenulispora pinisilvae]
MPGGRLTHSDRRAIAAGLAADLSYNEIAKRLERPTSTVTREVMRNGGPLAYRADGAHQAAHRKARRSKAARAAGPGALPSADFGRDPEVVRAYAESLTGILESSGMPRMMAGVLACLYTADSGGMTSAELVARLRVSPASISKAVGYLETQELIQRGRGPDRRDRYVVDDDVWFRATLASARLNDSMAAAARSGVEVLGAGTPAGERLREMSRFLDQISRDLVASAERWRAVPPEADEA